MRIQNSILLLKVMALAFFINLSSVKDSIKNRTKKTALPTFLDYRIEEDNPSMGSFANHEMVRFNNKFWMVAGDNRYSRSWQNGNQVWSSTNGKSWVRVAAGPFTERKNHSLLAYKNKLWLIGGIDNNGTILSDIWTSTNGITWKQVNSFKPLVDIGQNNSVVFKNRIFVFRGNGRTHEEVWSTADGSYWKLETKNAFPVRSHYKTVVHNNQIYVIGGWIRGGNHTNEVWVSQSGSDWSKKMTTTIFNPRIDHSVTSHEGKVWLVGGQSSKKDGQRIFYNDIWYSEDLKSWTQYTKRTPIKDGIHSHTTISYKNRLWTFGGYVPDGSNADVLSPLIWSMD